MQGWLVVNNFIRSAKFLDLYTMIAGAAAEQNIALRTVRTGELISPIGEDFPPPFPDFVLFWDKDTVLAARLEGMGIPVFNRARAIEVCDNKILTAAALCGKTAIPRTIPAPKTFEGVGYSDADFLDAAAEALRFPLVVKEAYGSFGRQVYLAHTMKELIGIVAGLGHKDFLMQEFIDGSAGRDVRINVVGEQVVSAMLRTNSADFRSNVTLGGQTRPYTPTREEEEAALSACRALGLDFAGVDILFGKEGPLVCEVNSNPNYKSSFECNGVDMGQYIFRHIAEKIG